MVSGIEFAIDLQRNIDNMKQAGPKIAADNINLTTKTLDTCP